MSPDVTARSLAAAAFSAKRHAPITSSCVSRRYSGTSRRSSRAAPPRSTRFKRVQPIRRRSVESLDRLQRRLSPSPAAEIHTDRPLVFAEDRLPALPLIAQQPELAGVGQLGLHRSRQRLHDLRTLVPQAVASSFGMRSSTRSTSRISRLLPPRVASASRSLVSTTVPLIDRDLRIDLVLDQTTHLARIRSAVTPGAASSVSADWSRANRSLDVTS